MYILFFFCLMILVFGWFRIIMASMGSFGGDALLTTELMRLIGLPIFVTQSTIRLRGTVIGMEEYQQGLHNFCDISVWLQPLEGHEELYGTGWSLRSAYNGTNENNKTRNFVTTVNNQTAKAGNWYGYRDYGFAHFIYNISVVLWNYRQGALTRSVNIEEISYWVREFLSAPNHELSSVPLGFANSATCLPCS